MSEWCGTGGDVSGMSQSSRLLPPQTEWKSPVPVKGREQPSVTLHTWWRHLVSRDKNHQISTYRVAQQGHVTGSTGAASCVGEWGQNQHVEDLAWMSGEWSRVRTRTRRATPVGKSECVERAEADLIGSVDSPAFSVIEFLVQEIACVVPSVNVNILRSADRIHEF